MTLYMLAYIHASVYQHILLLLIRNKEKKPCSLMSYHLSMFLTNIILQHEKENSEPYVYTYIYMHTHTYIKVNKKMMPHLL